jgi:AraC-like DNA-binding protein
VAVPLSSIAFRPASAGHSDRSTYTEMLEPGAGPIECLWIGLPGWSPRTLRLLPDGRADVVWDGNTIRVVPPRPFASRHLLATLGPTMGVRLRPGWAAPILRAAIGSLPPVADLGDLCGDRSAAGLARMLGQASSPIAAARLLAQHLESVEGAADPAVLAAVHRLSQTGSSVQETATHVGLSARQLRRSFHNDVGLSPKAFQRVIRFQRFRHLATSTPPTVNMARAAAMCGYSDQAHLVHDCRQLADTTPTALVRSRTNPTPPNPAHR